MSDDLVQRLRNSLTPDIWAMRCEAADRIKALEAELRSLCEDYDDDTNPELRGIAEDARRALEGKA